MPIFLKLAHIPGGGLGLVTLAGGIILGEGPGSSLILERLGDLSVFGDGRYPIDVFILVVAIHRKLFAEAGLGLVGGFFFLRRGRGDHLLREHVRDVEVQGQVRLVVGLLLLVVKYFVHSYYWWVLCFYIS